MAPIVHGLEVEYQDRINFVYLDASDPRNEEAKRIFGFYVQPEFYLIDGDGNILKKWVGMVERDSLIKEFDANLP